MSTGEYYSEFEYPRPVKHSIFYFSIFLLNCSLSHADINFCRQFYLDRPPTSIAVYDPGAHFRFVDPKNEIKSGPVLNRKYPKGSSAVSELSYSGLPGELKTDLLLRLNTLVADNVAKYGAGLDSAKYLKLGEAFSPFLSQAALKLTIQSNKALAWRQIVRDEVDALNALRLDDNAYISLTYVGGRLTALMSMMESSPNNQVASKSRVNDALDAEGRFMATLAEKLFERGVLILPTVGHYSEGDSVRSWGSGVFQYGIFVDPQASRFGNDSSSIEFRDHDIRHIRDYLAKFGQRSLSNEEVIKLVADYRRNLLTTEALNRSIQSLPAPVKRVAYTALYMTGHEQNVPLEDFSSRQQRPDLALLDYFTRIAGKPPLNLGERRRFNKWWRESIQSLNDR